MDRLAELRQKNEYHFKIDFEKFREWIIYECSAIMAQRNINSDFIPNKDQSEVIRQMYLYQIGSKEFKGTLTKGIGFLGPIGTGKTLLITAFVRGLNAKFRENDDSYYRREVKFITARHIAESAIDESNNNPLIPTYSSIHGLAIDDVGKEPLEIMSFGNHIRPFCDLVAKAYDKGTKLFITSNFTEKELSDHYGASASDRLKEMVNYFVLKGDSLRK